MVILPEGSFEEPRNLPATPKTHKMDSLTHIVLGACIGEAGFSKEMGKKALLLGAFAQSFPDVDGLASFFLSPTQNLLFHRSVTHSFLFVALAASALAWLSGRLFPSLQLPRLKLTLFFALQMGLHILLDTCNAYGTQLLWPFSSERISFDFCDRSFLHLALADCVTGFPYIKKTSTRPEKMDGGRNSSSLFLSCLCLFQQGVCQPPGGKDTAGATDSLHRLYHQAYRLQYLVMVYNGTYRGRVLHRLPFRL